VEVVRMSVDVVTIVTGVIVVLMECMASAELVKDKRIIQQI
jgi:hypothetical protein